MAQQQRDDELKGVLFRNKRKSKETHPSHTGSCQIGGAEYWISAWVNTPKAGGEKYFSFRFELKDDKRDGGRAVQGSKGGRNNEEEEDEDDIPF